MKTQRISKDAAVLTDRNGREFYLEHEGRGRWTVGVKDDWTGCFERLYAFTSRAKAIAAIRSCERHNDTAGLNAGRCECVQ